MIPKTWPEQALQRIQPYILVTPLTYDPQLNIYLKWENQQVTGSFKARGALNKVLSLQNWERERGLVTASAGNHGQGVALAGKITSSPVLVFASEHASALKIAAMRSLGANVELVPGGYSEAEQAGIAYSVKNSSTWISPYNDGQIIAGQGTIALELLQQLPTLEKMICVVPAGGGGLVSGIGAVFEGVPHHPKIIAVQSYASPFLHALYHTGSQDHIDELPSLADGLSGPVEPGSVTIPLTRKYLDGFVLVHEDQITGAIAYSWKHYQQRIEGSAAVVLAAVLNGLIDHRPLVLIITGGNIQSEVFDKIVSDHSA